MAEKLQKLQKTDYITFSNNFHLNLLPRNQINQMGNKKAIK